MGTFYRWPLHSGFRPQGRAWRATDCLVALCVPDNLEIELFILDKAIAILLPLDVPCGLAFPVILCPAPVTPGFRWDRD